MSDWLTPKQVAGVFAEEMKAVKGVLRDPFADRSCVFTRGVLPKTIEVAPRDKFQGGVALFGTENDIFVHPFVFRQVCSNGAIATEALETIHIPRRDLPRFAGGDEVATIIREAIRGCCAPEAFVMTARQIRAARKNSADKVMEKMIFLSMRQTNRIIRKYASEAIRRYDDGEDKSAYGLMNAITSVARDTRDPEMKWRLEALGGSVPALVRPRGKKAKRARCEPRSLIAVADSLPARSEPKSLIPIGNSRAARDGVLVKA